MRPFLVIALKAASLSDLWRWPQAELDRGATTAGLPALRSEENQYRRAVRAVLAAVQRRIESTAGVEALVQASPSYAQFHQ